MVTKAKLQFIALTKERTKEVLEDNLNKEKMGAWQRMRLYLGASNVPYGKIPQDEQFFKFDDESHEGKESEEEQEDVILGTWVSEMAKGEHALQG